MGHTMTPVLDNNFKILVSELKERIKSAQLKAAMAVNRELLQLYWEIGSLITARQAGENWGDAIISSLSKELQSAFPGMKGFSPRNLWRIRMFYLTYSKHFKIMPQAVAEIPWGHNILLLEKIKDLDKSMWYAHKTLENGWSRAVLWHQIDTQLYERQAIAQKTTNFSNTLPSPQSDLAQELIKDPYNFDFLTLEEDAHERHLENGLMSHLKKFLVELGVGFAFVGSQYLIKIGSDEFYLDLLFYHLKLRCYVVIEIKMKEFKPEYAGKMNFYLSAVDKQLKSEHDNPSIGIILCKRKNNIVVEYSLLESNRPIGVSEYQLLESLPKEIESNFPTLEQLEENLSKLL
jgi:predicted nuclease of restriction endonuclease-like (RecB) superfamily